MLMFQVHTAISSLHTIKLLPLLCLSLFDTVCLTNARTALCVKEKKNGYDPPISLHANTYLDLIRQSSIFIDKSLLIKLLVENPSKPFLVCRPKRWGKSINLDMIRMFVEMDIDKEGNAIPVNEQMANHRLFIKGEFVSESGKTEKLKTPPLISQHKSIIDNYLGKYPTIYINFTNIQGKTMQTIVGDMLSRISEAFKKHEYILNILRVLHKQEVTGKTDTANIEKNIEIFTMILNKIVTIERKTIEGSLNMLCQLIFDHFKTRVFLFIDDYDAPITAVLTCSEVNAQQEEDFRQFYTNLLISTFISNDHIEKGIATGVLHLWKEAVNDTRLQHIQQDHFFLDQELSGFFGMNSWETNTALEHYELPQKAINDINAFYCGYEFVGFPLKVYNPWSIAKVLANEDLQPKSWLKENQLECKTVNRFLKNFWPSKPFRARFLLPFNWNYNPFDIRIAVKTKELEWKALALFHKAGIAIYEPEQFKEMSSHWNITVLADQCIIFLLQAGFFTVDYRFLPDGNFFCFRIATPEVREFLRHAYPVK